MKLAKSKCLRAEKRLKKNQSGHGAGCEDARLSIGRKKRNDRPKPHSRAPGKLRGRPRP